MSKAGVMDRINFDPITTTGAHRRWAEREAAIEAGRSPEPPLLTLLAAPSILDAVADEIERADPSAKHAVGRHDVPTLLAIASGNPGGHEHNRARLALHAFVRDCGEDGIRSWAQHNDAPTLIVGLRAVAELMREVA